MTLPTISTLSHPKFHANFSRWYEYRLTFEGGEQFMQQYLLRLDDETDKQWELRKENTPVPAVAKEAVKDVQRSIAQRLVDVSRTGGSKLFQQAAAGEKGGIDREGNSMNIFMAHHVLEDLLVMGRVGIYVDNVAPGGMTLASGGATPYAYMYSVEDILNWDTLPPEAEGQFKMVLLRDHRLSFHSHFGIQFPRKINDRLRLMWIGDDGFMRYMFLKEFKDDKTGEVSLQAETPVVNSTQMRLDDDDPRAVVTQLREIPFVMPSLSGSLLADVASYQRALMNIASNEAMFGININSPMLTIQKDFRADGRDWKKPPGHEAEPGGQRSRNREERQGVRSGWVRGRYYGVDEAQPGWIAPPVDSLTASSDYRQKLADEVRQLVNVAVQNQTGTRSESRETRELSSQGLESGLHFIAMQLQQAENQISKFWSMYEGDSQPATISYPKRYSLKTDNDRIKDANDTIDTGNKIPGQQAKKQAAKQAFVTMFTGKISSEEMEDALKEIENHPYINDFDAIMAMREGALISDKTVAASQDLPESEVEQAKKDRAEQVKLTLEAQTSPEDRPAARGAPEMDANPQSGEDERAEDDQKRGEQKAPTNEDEE